MRKKTIELLPEDVEFWSQTTGREPFVSANRVCKGHAKAGRKVKVIWQSTHCISVIPQVETEPFRKRSRKIPTF